MNLFAWDTTFVPTTTPQSCCNGTSSLQSMLHGKLAILDVLKGIVMTGVSCFFRMINIPLLPTRLLATCFCECLKDSWMIFLIGYPFSDIALIYIMQMSQTYSLHSVVETISAIKRRNSWDTFEITGVSSIGEEHQMLGYKYLLPNSSKKLWCFAWDVGWQVRSVMFSASQEVERRSRLHTGRKHLLVDKYIK